MVSKCCGWGGFLWACYGLMLPAAADPILPRIVADNFDNPTGVAIQPGTGDVFVATHRGVMRVYRDAVDRHLGCSYEIAGYPTDVYGKGPQYEIGPLSVAFLSPNALLVGDGSRADGEELIRLYEVGNHAREFPIRESAAIATLGPIPSGEQSSRGEGNFYGLAVNQNAIFASANGDDTKGWIVRSPLEGGKPGQLQPFIATKQAVQVDAPCGLTINSAGDLVVSQMGEISLPEDSLICIYDVQSGELKKSYQTGLNDIIGIAYSPDGRLFGVDFSWTKPEAGGLYEFTLVEDTCTPRKILSLHKPTALTFDREGALLVTVLGDTSADATKSPGQLLSIKVADLQLAP